MNVIKTSFLALFTALTLSTGTVFAQEAPVPAPVDLTEYTVAVLAEAQPDGHWDFVSEQEYADPQECWAAAQAFNTQSVGTGFVTLCFPAYLPTEPTI